MTLTAFVLLILSLALTLNLYFPVLSNARFMVYSFATGWLAGELALQIALIEMLLAAILLINGSFSGLFGFFAILALFVNWLALLHHHYQGQALGPVVESALQKALGGIIEPPSTRISGAHSNWRLTLQPNCGLLNAIKPDSPSPETSLMTIMT